MPELYRSWIIVYCIYLLIKSIGGPSKAKAPAVALTVLVHSSVNTQAGIDAERQNGAAFHAL